MPATTAAAHRDSIANPLIGYWKPVRPRALRAVRGRARRPEYWWYTLANIVIGLLLIVLSAVSSIFVVLLVIFSLALIVPSLAVTVRRLHDSDKSGWWILFGLVPVVGGTHSCCVFSWARRPGRTSSGPSRRPSPRRHCQAVTDSPLSERYRYAQAIRVIPRVKMTPTKQARVRRVHQQQHDRHAEQSPTVAARDLGRALERLDDADLVAALRDDEAVEAERGDEDDPGNDQREQADQLPM